MENRIEAFTFFGSFYDAFKEMKSSDRLAMYDAIMAYAFEGKEPVLKNSTQRMAFTLLKPNIDSGIEARLSGKKGGRPAKDKTEVTEKEKTGVSKKQKGGLSKNKKQQEQEQELEQEQEIEQELENISGGSPARVDFNELLSIDEMKKLFGRYMDASELINEVQTTVNLKETVVNKPFEYIIGYADKKGWPVKAGSPRI